MLPYHPALRAKKGEYYAGAKIARDIQKHVQPRFIIPPPRERDPEKGAPLTPDEIAHLTGERIGKHWPLFPAFLDPQFVASVLGDNGLRKMFDIAQSRNKNLVAVATLTELQNPIYRAFICSTWPKLGVHVGYDEIDRDLLAKGMETIGCSPQDCFIFVDFTGADLTPNIATDSVSGIIELLRDIAPWGRIVFQGSAFPTTNPADPGGQLLVPRNEWKTFLAALKECSVPLELIGYGDFGADCGEINFPRKAGGRPVRHLRYTTKTDTLVVRGSDTGADAEVMVDVCERIVKSAHYAGQAFSYADDEIWRSAKGMDTRGGASTWREWNMAHHMTRVVRDLGAMAGTTFEDGRVSQFVEQFSLFDVEPD